MPCVTNNYRPLKRVIDIIGAVIGMIVMVPFFIIIAIWIKRDSAGPIFYRQARVGLHGKMFNALKFRSMIMDGDRGTNDGITTPDKQSRITHSGHFIRKYRLDELAQLWNVLIGDMSLVGPRPQTLPYIQIYPDIYKMVHTVRPGVTGLASIKFHEREERMLLEAGDNANDVYIQKILPLKFHYNLFYVSHYGLWFDIKIIWWTIKGMIGKI